MVQAIDGVTGGAVGGPSHQKARAHGGYAARTLMSTRSRENGLDGSCRSLRSPFFAQARPLRNVVHRAEEQAPTLRVRPEHRGTSVPHITRGSDSDPPPSFCMPAR